ncbi:hypothetical protein cypCar_00020201 [Cyprinus carpio]|nr:hypothetical protein cypCar_00020201 [Cyprinus carpio]
MVVVKPKPGATSASGIRSSLYKAYSGELPDPSTLDPKAVYADFKPGSLPLICTMNLSPDKPLVESIFGKARGIGMRNLHKCLLLVNAACSTCCPFPNSVRGAGNCEVVPMKKQRDSSILSDVCGRPAVCGSIRIVKPDIIHHVSNADLSKQANQPFVINEATLN